MASRIKTHPKKGVKKSKDLGKLILKEKSSDSPDTSPAENVLTFPLLKTVDRDRMLPRYASVLNRTQDEGVVMDDLDALQLELETLLSAVVVRSRVLHKELLVLSTAEEKRDKKSKVFKPPLPPGKRGLTQNRPVKKLKETSNKVREMGQTPLPIKITNVKSVPSTSTSSLNACVDQEPADTPVEVQAPKIILPKYDAPNRFWASVDPYCTDITVNDTAFLEDLIKEHEHNSHFFKIPPLGPHYSTCWAQEDLMREQDSSHADCRNKNKRPSSPAAAIAVLKRCDKQTEGSTTGPLTQRLISALMEENANKATNNEKANEKSPEKSIEKTDGKKCTGGENETPLLGLMKNFSGNNSASFEKRVKKELEEQGLLDSSNHNQFKDAGNDEILQELKRCQADLKTITAHNLQHLNKLLRLSTIEIRRQDLKKQLKDVDNDILEKHRNVVASKQKKKPLTQEEEAQCWKVLKERDALLKQIERLQ